MINARSWISEDDSEPNARRNRSEVDSALLALSRLEAREAEAPKDARELVGRLSDIFGRAISNLDFGFKDKAAAEIEHYVQYRIANIESGMKRLTALLVERPIAAEPKTVPKKMLDHIVIEGWCEDSLEPDNNEIRLIAARYGYEVTE